MKKTESKLVALIRELIPDVLGVGIPLAAFKIAELATGLRGAPMITAALRTLGCGNMKRGVGVLVAGGVLVRQGSSRIVGAICDRAETEGARYGDENSSLLHAPENT